MYGCIICDRPVHQKGKCYWCNEIMKDNTLFRGANPSKITQRFDRDKHKGIDVSSSYGTWLVAPQDCIIERVVTPDSIDESLASLASGYGIVMRNKSEPIRYLYWHCLPIFPVVEGQEVAKGQQVAMMGNSGFVKRGGVVVPVKVRLQKPFKGTHVHYEKFTEVNGKREYIDPEPDIDWTSGVDVDILSEIKVVLMRMLKLLR